jgi:LmeA-like phospholipid-binding
MSSQPPDPQSAPRQSQLIRKVLSPAIRLWLRSQVEAIETLEFQIQGGDRQVLSGHIPSVAIAATQVIYQGFHLSQIAVSAQEIRVNLGQVIKGKPLRLLAVVPVTGKATLQQADLNASLRSPELADAFNEVVLPLLRSCLTETEIQQSQAAQPPQAMPPQAAPPQIQIEPDRLLLKTTLQGSLPIPFVLRTGIQVVEGSRLQFDRPERLLPDQPSAPGQPLPLLQGFEIDLGSEVQLRSLVLATGKIFCEGQINVIP